MKSSLLIFFLLLIANIGFAQIRIDGTFHVVKKQVNGKSTSETNENSPVPGEFPADPDVPTPKVLNIETLHKRIGYPKAAREAGLEGKVVVRVKISETGSYISHEVLKSTDDIFKRTVEEHIKLIRCEPATKNGKPVQSIISIPFNFQL